MADEGEGTDMADVPQPSPEPHEPGDEVRVYESESDPDDRFQGLVCTVVERLEEGSDAETEDDLDRYSYRLENADTGEELPTTFDHSDLVSVE